MNAVVTWQDIAVRLAAAVIAGAVIGFDRGARGQVAGLRTTILMCLAATGAMIEANFMLSITGKTASSFTEMDALRFPLGILSGIGFIGAGAIVRRGKLVTGVTTAATLWLITVVGLILGAGYLGTGAAIVAIAFVVLAALKQLEPLIFTEHHGDLRIESDTARISSDAIEEVIRGHGYKIVSAGLAQGERRTLRYRLEWHSSKGAEKIPDIVETLAARDGVLGINWQPFPAGNELE